MHAFCVLLFDLVFASCVNVPAFFHIANGAEHITVISAAAGHFKQVS